MSAGEDGAEGWGDDGEYGRTTIGTDMFGTQEVPDYPAIARLGGFEILGRIARGGMAELYLARSRQGDGTVRHVVVKRVLTEMQHDAEMVRMFVEEGRIARRLFHPNVCHVYECGEDQGLTYMALEWVHGVSLRDVIRRSQQHGGLPVPIAVHVIAKIAAALEYVHHARGIDGKPLAIIHQDVSPHNVMLGWKGDVKLLDFGIAKTSAQAQIASNHPQGKYEYMSPEQLCGAPIDARSDIFALGVCLHEALCGRSLHGRESLPMIMSAVVEEPAPSIRSVRPELPEALEHIVAKALAKRPEDRYQSAAEMQRALEAWLDRAGQNVSEARVALIIGGMFDAEDKAPLRPGAANITGTLPAILSGEIELPRSSSDPPRERHREPSLSDSATRTLVDEDDEKPERSVSIAVIGAAIGIALVILITAWIVLAVR
ncbi:serine/threonine protein kinase [Sandaracinus amylolyticus]|uniref:Serine/threonine protein kinase n=1 Tax=Sandaracinus amylolyticus TaxID=927083 RepID=A0A0F6SG92_9BACT|nr:serine/threonine-protein kinase [Sandaracinus amylolyticus]AKF08289.1 serine/threonine protein kinase [Sandaracinus amylolyticus]